MPRRNPNSKHAQKRAKGKKERALKEPRLGSQLEGKSLKAKGAGTQGTRVEEPGGSSHRFLCTKEVGTPKGRALIGEKKSIVVVSATYAKRF